MKILKSIIPFTIVFCIHLLSILFNWDDITVYTKPLLLITLISYFLSNAKLNLTVLFALIFSLLGDVLLIFQSKASLFFVLGLVAFLIAHICYIIYFLQIKKQSGNAKWNWLIIIIALTYGVTLVLILFPRLGDMKLPVIVYAATICTMLISAIHIWLAKRNSAGLYLAIGATLFVLSDSILAFNKFHTSFASASFLIMLTYGLAQLFIIMGVVKLHPIKISN